MHFHSERTLAARVFPPPTLAFDAALLLMTLLYFTLSPLALVQFGFNYGETGGSPLEKIHPGTLLAGLVLATALAARRNPVNWLTAESARQPALALYVIVLGILVAHSTLVSKTPFTPLIDSYFAPLLVLLLMQTMTPERGQAMALVLHVVMALNAVIALGEFATGQRLTPMIVGGMLLEQEWRSSALLGHPLANASLAGAYLLCLALGGGHDLGRNARRAAFLLNMAAMVTFGGRAATLTMLLLMLLFTVFRLAAIARGAPFRRSSVLIGLLATPVAGIALLVLAEAGFFDLFIERFVDDAGSASTRVEMFELFNYVSLHELLTGPDSRHIESLQGHYGLEFGIESFWVASVLQYGLIIASLLFTGLFLLCREIVRACRPGAVWVLLFFFAVASTSVSLSAKSPLLAELALILLALLRPQPADRA